MHQYLSITVLFAQAAGTVIVCCAITAYDKIMLIASVLHI